MALKINRSLQKAMRATGWVLLIALVACMIKVLIWERNYYATKSNETRAESMPVLTSVEKPTAVDDTEVSEEDIEDHKTLGNTPKIIEIERLKLRARVESSSASDTVTLPLPLNIHDTEWFSASSKLGEGGVTIISGLHSAASKPGAFKNLDSLEKGDTIKLIDGDDKEYLYEVAEFKIVNVADIGKELPIMQQKYEDKETVSLIMAKKSSSGEEYQSIVMLRATRK